MKIKDIFHSWAIPKRIRDIGIWCIIYAVLFINLLWTNTKFAFSTSTCTLVGMLSIYFITKYLLIPYFLLPNRKLLYTLLTIILLASVTYVCVTTELFFFQFYEVNINKEFKFSYPFIRSFVLFLTTFTVVNVNSFIDKNNQDNKQRETLLMEKKELEIRMLKSQINSHFLFNALNNIYSMIYFKDEYTSGYVLKLSQMLRYVLEDCESDLTPLEKELEYIDNYIDFQKLRFENDKKISFHRELDNRNIHIPPMLFQPFVENCFKYCSLDTNPDSYIDLSLTVKEKKLEFIAINSQPMMQVLTKKKKTEMGIKNVKKRLDIYYRNNYNLDIIDQPDHFKIILSINL
ncbi:MAG: histidine kinase [Candidatus Azobacteroides sp.]|nr:histidine kinase [Candidatus Azobacteroides sp.]